MKIICWNVRYDLTIKKYLHITEMNPDILILLECEKQSFDFIKDVWKYKNWYNDDQYDENSNLGIAILSNNYPIAMCESFNRNYRYLVPYRIKFTTDFYIFVTWTKPNPYYYSENIIKALNDKQYEEYFNGNTMLIGDFNTATTKNDNDIYKKIISGNLYNTTEIKDEYKFTYYHQGNEYFTNDYCLITKKIKENFTIEVEVPDFDSNIIGKEKYKGLSDHCPIIITVIDTA